MNNDLLKLVGDFSKDNFHAGGNEKRLRRNQPFPISHIADILNDLSVVLTDYEKSPYLDACLVPVTYFDITPKSRRIDEFFHYKRCKASKCVVGARFVGDDNRNIRHLITYYVPKEAIKYTIDCLTKTFCFFKRRSISEITPDVLKQILNQILGEWPFDISSSRLAQLLIDLSNVYCIKKIPIEFIETSDANVLITIFKTDVDMPSLLKKLKTPNAYAFSEIVDSVTAVVPRNVYQEIIEEYPDIVSMNVNDRQDLHLELENDGSIETIGPKEALGSPNGEPIIGVIDTVFQKGNYFDEWVIDNRVILPKGLEEIEITERDSFHGLAIDSLIIDGPRWNPDLDDHCGHFRVVHYGVALHDSMSASHIGKAIRKAVSDHPEIHVWNLSLGSRSECPLNFISPIAAAIDEIESANPAVVFIIASTNDEKESGRRIGSPADSINSVVVTSCDKKGNKTSYDRRGPVLSFFVKPDVACFGGSENERMNVVSKDMVHHVLGTSFAAPWIARKMAFMIDTLGLSREIAKALLIDSTMPFSHNPIKKEADFLGYGIVPTAIESVVSPQKDETKFFIEGETLDYYTATYRLPIPLENEKHPFRVKACFCYFPHCERNQGVDYTCSELNLQFGRTNEDGSGISPINGDLQNDDLSFISEGDARKEWRKWDNVKFVAQKLQTKKIPIRSKNKNGYWGIKITSKSRNGENSKGHKFGLVITLKNIYGRNSTEAFEQLCIRNMWMVQHINIEERVELMAMANQEITFK